MNIKTIKRIYKSYILAKDFLLSAGISILLINLFCSEIEHDQLIQLIGMLLTTISIIFAFFTPAMTIILSSGSMKFLDYIETKNELFSKMQETLKYTMRLLIFSLIYNLIYYILLSIPNSLSTILNFKIFIFISVFLTFYSITASFSECIEAINFIKYNYKYYKKNEKK